MDIVIRRAAEAELAAVGELTASAYLADGMLTFGEADPYLAVLRDARRRAEHAEVLVALSPGGELLGTVTYVADGGEFAELSAGAEEAEFRMLAVSPTARGRGAGEALARECVRRARRAGKRRVVISSASLMHTAHRIYARLGFVRTPERDWKPVPDLEPLQAFALELPDPERGDHNI